MRWFKRSLSIFLTLAMVLTLAGCAGQETTQEASDIAGEIIGTIAGEAIQKGLDALQENSESSGSNETDSSGTTAAVSEGSFSLDSIPEFNGEDAYVVINNNEPFFTDEEKTSTEPFETYSELDSLGRCGVAYANICQELMPTEERGEIGSVKPSGWVQAKYDWVDGKYLYNRCHIIGFQLAGENANPKDLLTGTRYLNIDGMLGFENLVADYVHETNNHVLYRVTPIFKDNELVCRGLLMEGYSVEDQGEGVCYNVYCYNNEPGVTIDYATGESWAS